MERRLKIRGSLTDWARHCGYEPARHHKLILDSLERLSRAGMGQAIANPLIDMGKHVMGSDGTISGHHLPLRAYDDDNGQERGGFTYPELKRGPSDPPPGPGIEARAAKLFGSPSTQKGRKPKGAPSSKKGGRAHTKLDRLAIFMPPGSAKSTYASILFPAWYLAHHPDHCVIAASHTQELAERWGRKVRGLLTEHEAVLGVSLSPDSAAAGRWDTSAGGEYFAAGVGGSITGRRADLVIIDDPVRSREDANSELIRDKTFDWYKSDLYTRLKPGGRIVLIQTRWHEDDLAGRLLTDAALGGDHWHVISLPALAEQNDPLGRREGESLWPEEFPVEEYERRKRAVGPRDWTALYQQRPAPEEGDYFKAEWLKPYASLPPRQTLRVYGGSDYAVTQDGGDYTVHVVVGLDPDGRMYLLDLWRKQSASDVWVEAFCDLVKKWKPIGWAEENVQITAGIGPYLSRRQRERGAYCFREQFPTRGDKAQRAQSIRGRMSSEGLYCPTGAPWFADLRSELLSFPAGKHDDQVDALGLVGQLLDKMLVGSKLPAPVRPKPKPGYVQKILVAKPEDWAVF